MKHKKTTKNNKNKPTIKKEPAVSIGTKRKVLRGLRFMTNVITASGVCFLTLRKKGAQTIGPSEVQISDLLREVNVPSTGTGRENSSRITADGIASSRRGRFVFSSLRETGAQAIGPAIKDHSLVWFGLESMDIISYEW